MTKMTQEEIKEVLEKHKHWLLQDCNDWALMRADLRGADLHDVDLHGANLSGAILRETNLSEAILHEVNFCETDLYGADLSGAYLHRANLSGAYSRGAYFRGADLNGANLRGANLREANLCKANLYGANLRGAELCGANLYRADLGRANLFGANLHGVNLCRADLFKVEIDNNMMDRFFPLVCPETGEFIGWKKCKNDIIVKLKITDDAKRLSAFGRKCRCSKAIVLEFQNIDGTQADCIEVESGYDPKFKYRIGETAEVIDFDEDRQNECSTGIHFFLTRREAVEYPL